MTQTVNYMFQHKIPFSVTSAKLNIVPYTYKIIVYLKADIDYSSQLCKITVVI